MPTNFISLETKGVQRMVNRMQQGDLVAQQLLVGTMQQAVDLTAANAAVPAPTSEANQPPTPYYVRDVGTQYADHNRGESQHLSKNWGGVVEIRDEGVVGKVSPRSVTYAKYVHGLTSQIEAHRRRQWRNVGKITSDVRRRVVELFGQSAKRFGRYLKTGKL